MRTTRLTALLLAIAAVEVAAQQLVLPPRDVGRRTPASVASGSVVGRVFSAESGAPLRRAEIVAVSQQMQPRIAISDDEGRFTLTELDAGTWQLTASKTGYTAQQYGQRRPFEPAQALRLAEGQQASADFALLRASTISGRIYDEFGEPLAAAHVHVLRARLVQKRRYLQRVGDGDLTDDTGAFRIYGLPPGEYFVTASLRVAPADSVIQTTYAPTYYPGTGSFAEAQRVLLASGNDVLVDFPVMPFRTARLSGTVLESNGAPANAFLNLSSEAGELGVPLGFGGATRPDGTFTLPDVPPGNYILNAALKGSGFGSEVAAIPLTVYGDDVTGLTLVTAKPGTMRGAIVADTGVTRRLPADVSILARSTRANAESTYAEPARNAFNLTVPAGPFRLDIGAPEGWVVKAIVMNGSDVSDEAIDIKGEQDVPVRVVLSDRLSEVSGTIARDAMTRTPTIVVFPYDSAKWSPPSRYVRAVAADERGAFRVTGLPPSARYLAAAIDSLEDGDGEDPDFLARIRDLAVSFDLGEGDKRVLDLRVIQR